MLKPTYYTTKFFTENSLAIEIEKKKNTCLFRTLNARIQYEFWYDCVKPKYGEKTKLYSMDTDFFILYIKTDDIYKDIAEDVQTRFDNSNYELDRSLPKGKKQKK